jgi:putative SbcD/Mre11-related phosphoesterase
VTEFKFVNSYPAVHFPEIDLVAIADLHLGLEGSMTSRGNYVPEFQLEQVKKEIKEISSESEASKILVNGDLKNQYSTSYSEKKEIKELIGELKENFDDVILIKGNHDTFVEDLAEDEGLRVLEEFREDGFLFVHGHEEIEGDYETLVIGHEHPALALEDEVGVTEKVDALLHLEEDDREIFVLPAYSPISNGSEVNRMKSSELLSPVLKEENIGEFEAYAISREAGEFYFGKLQDL